MKAGGERRTEDVARIGKIMKAANGTMNTDAPQGAISISWRDHAVERIFGAVSYGFCAVDNVGFVGRYPIAFTQGVLALFGNAFRMAGHGGHLRVYAFGVEMMRRKTHRCIEAAVLLVCNFVFIKRQVLGCRS